MLGARWFQEALQTIFFIYLARVSTATYGEFMMALGLGSILLMVAEFGLNLPFVGLAAGSQDKITDVLSQALILKAGFFVLALTGALIFISWQDYSPPLRRLLLLIGTGVALEALASTFFVVLQVEGRQDQEAKIRTAGTALGFGYGLLALFFGAAPLVIAFFKLIDSGIKLAGGVWLLVRRRNFQWLWPTLREVTGPCPPRSHLCLNGNNRQYLQQSQPFFSAKTWRCGGGGPVQRRLAGGGRAFGYCCQPGSPKRLISRYFPNSGNKTRPAVARLAHTTARWLLALALPSMFLLWVESDRIIPLIYGPHYTQAIWLQQYLVVTIIIGFWHNLAGFLLLSMGKERMLLSFYLMGLTFNLAWCLLVLPIHPLTGAALAIILTKGLVAFLTISYCQYRIPFITIDDLQHTAAAIFLSAGLYFGSKPFLPREAAELLTLAPLAVLGWYWKR